MLTCLFRGLSLVAIALLCCPTQAKANTIYDVHFDGTTFDVTGFIEVDALGVYASNAFDSHLVNYSLTASGPDAGAFTFTLENSTWGPGLNGAGVTVQATATQLILSAPAGGNFEQPNAFLLSDANHNGSIENLRLFQDQFGFRTPNPPNTVVFSTVNPQFVFGTLATTAPGVPEPATVSLVGVGLACLGLGRRKAARA